MPLHVVSLPHCIAVTTLDTLTFYQIPTLKSLKKIKRQKAITSLSIMTEHENKVIMCDGDVA